MLVEDIKILFLAHYAPKTINSPTHTEAKDAIYAKYHFEVFKILKSLFPKTYPSNTPEIMLTEFLDVDYVFSLYNKMPFRNSEVFISSVSEYHGIPYLGATPNIRALAEDKHLAKMMAKYAGVNTPKWCIYSVGSDLSKPYFDPPYFCKPRFGAASIGIDETSVCKSWNEAQKKILMLHAQKMDVILEQQIQGVYHTSPVLYNFKNYMTLPCIAQHSSLKDGIVTYEQKRKIAPGLTRNVVTDTDLNNQIQKESIKMYNLVQPLDYTRFDYVVELKTDIPYFIEFNVCCNLGRHSTISQSATSIGISYEELIENITYSSLFRNGLLDEDFGKQF